MACTISSSHPLRMSSRTWRFCSGNKRNNNSTAWVRLNAGEWAKEWWWTDDKGMWLFWWTVTKFDECPILKHPLLWVVSDGKWKIGRGGLVVSGIPLFVSSLVCTPMLCELICGVCPEGCSRDWFWGIYFSSTGGFPSWDMPVLWLDTTVEWEWLGSRAWRGGGSLGPVFARLAGLLKFVSPSKLSLSEAVDFCSWSSVGLFCDRFRVSSSEEESEPLDSSVKGKKKLISYDQLLIFNFQLLSASLV